jgi:hypothetical protein
MRRGPDHAVDCKAPAHIIQLLLQQEAKDEEGRAMFLAASTGQQEVVHLLLTAQQQTADRTCVLDQLRAALCGAASQACLDLVQSLLTLSNDILPGPTGTTPGHILKHILGRAVEAAVFGQKCDWETAEQGQLSYRPGTWSRFTQDQIKTVSVLLQEGADPSYGAVWLCLAAAQQQDGEYLQLLLDAGAEATEIALNTAAMFGSVEVVVYLLCASKGPVDPAGTALATAAQLGHTAVVKRLLVWGANVSAAPRTVAANNDLAAATMLLSLPTVRVTDMDLLKVLMDMAAKQRSFDLLWHSVVAAGMWASDTTPAPNPGASAS